MATPNNVFCSRCIYFQPHEWPTAQLLQIQPGDCRRHVPLASHTPRWPRVSGSKDWCGEFRAAQAPGGE